MLIRALLTRALNREHVEALFHNALIIRHARFVGSSFTSDVLMHEIRMFSCLSNTQSQCTFSVASVIPDVIQGNEPGFYCNWEVLHRTCLKFL
jgi:hypothetical protein